MMGVLAHKQRGIGFVGFIMIAAGVVFAAVAGMKLVPPYLHSAQIEEILKQVANDPEMRNASISEIKSSYAKRASINYITDITAEDLEIDKVNNQLILSANYSVKVPVAGNITLLLEFNPSSS